MKIILLICFIVLLISCGYTNSKDVTIPATASVVKAVHAYPDPVNPGATVVLNIQIDSAAVTFHGGKIIVTDSQGNSYRERISDAAKTDGTELAASIMLSPLIPAGDLLLQVFVVDSAGNSSNIGFVSLTIL